MYIFPYTILEYRPPRLFEKKKGRQVAQSDMSRSAGTLNDPCEQSSDHMGVSDPLCVTRQH
jgi:hypothetical protein